MNRNRIKRNAYRLWMELSYHGCLSYTELKLRTGLADRELNAALGWLAEEGKIEFDERCEQEYIGIGANIYF